MRLCAVSIVVIPALAGPCQGCDPDPQEVGVIEIDTGAGEDTSEAPNGAWGHAEFSGMCSDPWRLRQVPTSSPIDSWVIRGWIDRPDGWDTGASEPSEGPWVYVAPNQAPPDRTGWTHVEVTCGPVPDPTSQGWVVDVWYPIGG